MGDDWTSIGFEFKLPVVKSVMAMPCSVLPASSALFCAAVTCCETVMIASDDGDAVT